MSTPVVTIGTPDICFADGLTTVSADISRTGAETINIWYSLPVDVVTPEQASDAFFLIGHRVAMTHGTSLVMSTPVSSRLLHGARSLEDIYGLWFPDSDTVVDTHVKARTNEPVIPGSRGLATCFTGGIDSTYSLLNPPRELSHAVFVHGFDINLARTTHHSNVFERLNALAEELGISMLPVASNVQVLVSTPLTWGHHLHGPAIASVGILLAQVVGELLLPSSGSSLDIGARNGSHQATDRLTSTEYLHVTHHGTKVGRINKTASIARNETALQTVRPCYRTTVEYNCGECAKCIRTSLDMEVVGCRDAVKRNFKVFPTRSELLAGIRVTDRVTYRSARQAIAYIDEHGGNQAFRAAFQAAAADYELRQAKATLITTLGQLTRDRTDLETLSTLRGSFDDVRSRWRRRQIRENKDRAKARIRAFDPRRSGQR